MENNTGLSSISDAPQAEPWELDDPMHVVNAEENAKHLDATIPTDALAAENQNDSDDFPVRMFPRYLTDIVFALYRTRLFPIGYTMMAILFVVSVLVGKNARLITSLGKTMANLYIAFVAPKGEDKTRPIEWATAPLVRLDHDAHKEYIRQKKEYDAAKDSGNGASVEFPPSPRRYIMCDATDEAVLRQLNFCHESVGLRRDELKDLLGQSSRYTMKSSDLYLSLFSGARIEVDRATKDEVYFVEHPVVSIIGGIQPERFLSVFRGDRMDSGLFDRFLVVSRNGYTAKPWRLEGYKSDNLDAKYDHLVIRRLIDSTTWHGDYHLSAAAETALQSWQNEEENRLEREGSNLQFGVFRKIQVYALKLSLLLQILYDMDSAETNPEHIVSGENAIRATVIADYFYCVSTAYAEEILHPNITPKEKEVLDALGDYFTAKDGVKIAKTHGIGKTAFYGLLGKANGKYIEKKERGHYAKKYVGVSFCRNSHNYRS